MRVFLLLLLALPVHFTLLAQSPIDAKRDFYWIFGRATTNGLPERACVKFNTIPPAVESLFSTLDFGVTNTSFCDSTGNLLFYTNGRRIFNKNHQLMSNGDSLSEWQDLTGTFQDWPMIEQGVLALYLPGSNNLIYLLHEPKVWSFDNFVVKVPALLLTIIDANANDGIGAVVSKNEIIVEQRLEEGKITATRHANGRDWWVLVPGFNPQEYLKFLLDSQGLHFVENQSVGNAIPFGGGQAVFSPDGTRYARVEAYNGDYPDTLIIFGFDRCTGVLSNPVWSVKFDSSGAVGVAISPNSRYLYQSSTRYVYQYDLQAPDVVASRLKVAEYDGFLAPFATGFFLSQLAPDGKIYINSPNGVDVLHVIEHPDLPGEACGVCQHCVQLPTHNSFSLPNFPNYRLGPLDGSPCDTLGIDVAAGEEMPGMADMKIYPNPASTILTVVLPQEVLDAELMVVDFLGKVVYQGKVAGSEMRLDISQLTQGIYACRILTQDKAFISKKFVTAYHPSNPHPLQPAPAFVILKEPVSVRRAARSAARLTLTGSFRMTKAGAGWRGCGLEGW